MGRLGLELGLESGPHDNGRSLYILDWRLVVVEGGNALHYVSYSWYMVGRQGGYLLE